MGLFYIRHVLSILLLVQVVDSVSGPTRELLKRLEGNLYIDSEEILEDRGFTGLDDSLLEEGWDQAENRNVNRDEINRNLNDRKDTGLSEGHERSKRSVPSWAGLWTNAEVPFVILENFTIIELDRIFYAMNLLENQTCIRFIERTDEEYYLIFTKEYRTCYSYIGNQQRQNGQKVYLGAKCPQGTVIHEIMHNLGFVHEQNRFDRDDHITLYPEESYDNAYKLFRNIRPIAGDHFDHESIMHYKMTKTTINDNYLLYGVSKWVKEAPFFSFYDVKRLLDLYQCVPESCSKVCQNTGYLDMNCNCVCPKFMTGTHCETPDTDADCGGKIILTNSQSQVLVSPNYPDQYPAGPEGKRCVWYIQGEPNSKIKATVHSADLNCDSSDLKIIYNLKGQWRSGYCSGGDTRSMYVTGNNPGEHNNMIIYFDSKQGFTSNTSTGFQITVQAFQSGCYNNPCADGSLCFEDNGSYTCNCFHGYSGQDCSAVTATSSVTCGFEKGLRKDCFLHQVTSTFNNFDWVHYHLKRTMRPHSGSFYLAQKSDGQIALPTKSESILESWPTFENAERCLHVWYNIPDNESFKANLIISYYGATTTEVVLFNSYELYGIKGNTGGNWTLLNFDIPAIDGLKVRFLAIYDWDFICLDDISLVAGPCNNPVCNIDIEYVDPVDSSCMRCVGGNEACPLGIECLTSAGLSCVSNVCVCSSDKYWDDLEETCKNYIVEGEVCSGEGQCLPLLSCSNGFCSCESTQYWDGTDCVDKVTHEGSCAGIAVCQVTLTCVANICLCSSDKYWDSTSCVDKVGNGGSCTGGAVCQSSLVCLSGICSCTDPANNYWDSATSSCQPKKSHGTSCSGNMECSSNVCDVTCQCPIGQTWMGSICANPCTSTEYWDGTTCQPMVGNGGSCAGGAVCLSGLVCSSNICLCSDPANQYWDSTTSSCQPKVAEGGSCAGGAICQSNLDCLSNVCSCQFNQYWDSTTSSCQPKGGYLGSCSTSVEDSCQSNLDCQSDGTCDCTAPLTWNSGTGACAGSGNVFDCTFDSGQICAALDITGNFRIYPDGGVRVFVPHKPYGGSGRFLYFGKEMSGTVTYTNPQGISGSYCLDLATYLINARSYIKIYTREGSQGTKTLLQEVPFNKVTSTFVWSRHTQTVQLSSSTQIVIDALGTIGSYSSASMDNIQLNAGPC